jgi:hypothetical protein
MSTPVHSSEFSGAQLVGASGVFYTNPEDIRFQLALTTAEAYQDAGLPYVVVDASPMRDEYDTWVADAHQERGAMVVRAEIPGIATLRQQGVAYAVANGGEKIVGQEPEKTLMPTFADQISSALDDYDVLVIGRTQKAEDSLPPVQQRTERLAGWILEQTHLLPHDALSGGRGFTVAGAEVLADYPATTPGMNNWLYLYQTPIDARNRGLAIGGIDVDLMHPAQMVAEETGNPNFDRKRYQQFKMQLEHLLGSVPNTMLDTYPWARHVYSVLIQAGSNPSDAALAHIIDRAESRSEGYVPAERLNIQ